MCGYFVAVILVSSVSASLLLLFYECRLCSCKAHSWLWMSTLATLVSPYFCSCSCSFDVNALSKRPKQYIYVYVRVFFTASSYSRRLPPIRMCRFFECASQSHSHVSRIAICAGVLFFSLARQKHYMTSRISRMLSLLP